MVYVRHAQKGGRNVWETQGEIFHPIGLTMNKGVVKRLDAW